MNYEVLHLGLKQQLNSAEDYVLFDEIFGCIKGGAFRSAYIINWICIAESLKNKFYKMSDRDAEIRKKVIGEIERKEQNRHQTDRFLLEKAKEYKIIDQEEFLKLEHMCTLRGIYAHPIGNSPTEDEVITAIKIGVSSVLSKSPLFRHSYINSIVNSIYSERHFIDNELGNLNNFAGNLHLHIHPDVFEYFFSRSFAQLDHIIFQPDFDHFWYRGVCITNHLLKLIMHSSSINTWNLRTLITKYPSASTAIMLDPFIWERLDQEVKDMLIGFALEPLQNTEVVAPSKFNVEQVYNLINSGFITEERYKLKYIEVLTKVPYRVKKDYSIPVELYFHEIIEDLRSHDWYKQNPAIRAISSIHIDKISLLPIDKQVILGRNILQSADGNAKDAKEYIGNINNGQIYSTPHIVRGIIEEAFVNEDGKIRFKTRFLKEALMTLTTVDDEASTEIINEIKDEVRKGESKYSWWISDIDSTVNIIQHVIEMNILTEVQKVRLSELIDVICLLSVLQ